LRATHFKACAIAARFFGDLKNEYGRSVLLSAAPDADEQKFLPRFRIQGLDHL
jgi:hypothetical protein